MKSFLVKGLWERSPSELQCILLTGALLFAALFLYKRCLAIDRATSGLKQLEQETLHSEH